MPGTDGIASAASALRYWERRQEVATNNLANANTDGFKAERVFARLVGDALPSPDSATDRRTGTIRPTGNPLDLALSGDGFFVVQTEAGERWTRGGALRLDADGYLADADGNRLMGERGAVRLTRDARGHVLDPADIGIDATGVVEVGGVVVDRLRVEMPASASGQLQHAEGTRFVPTTLRRVAAAGERSVRQGALEDSNVNPISSLVDLLSIQRNYASTQRALSALDGVRSTIVNELGKIPA